MVKLLLILALAVFAAPPIDEAQVFEWWDDGIITPEEADEIFSRLEEDNYEEACLLAEVYAQEPCIWSTDSTTSPRKKRQKRKAKQTSSAKQDVPIIPRGSLTYKAQYDSDGHLKKHRQELQVQFYHFKLHLGSQELLSYRRDGFEAHFGQISTQELHSHLPLDTLWGTALLVPVRKFRIGALLDTSKTFHTRLTFQPNRQNELTAYYWRHADANAIALQARTTLGQISSWYQFGQDMPLVKIQLQNQGERLSWKTTAYLHGDSVPQGLNLSKGIAQNRLWASQTVNLHFPEAFNTILSTKVRTLSPVGSDSVSARLKATLTLGPPHLHPSLSATCVEASDNCNTTEYQTVLESAWENLILKASAKFRHETPPKIELATSYRQSKNALVKLSVSFPESNPTKSISLQNEFKMDSEHLGCDLVFAFKKTQKQKFQPNFANLRVNLKF